MAAADNSKKLGLMSRAAASLELRSEIITSNSDPDALAASLDAVAGLRSAIEGCKGLHAFVPLASAVQRIIEFVAEACAKGLPGPTEEFETAWQLMTTAIACGLELVEIGSPEETLSSSFWITPLSILALSLDALKAQLQVIAV